MTAIPSLDKLVELLTGGDNGNPEHLWFHKVARVGGAAAAAPVAGRWTSLWQYDGSLGPGAAPGGSPRIPTNATNGGLKQTDPGGGRQKWCLASGGVAITGRIP